MVFDKLASIGEVLENELELKIATIGVIDHGLIVFVFSSFSASLTAVRISFLDVSFLNKASDFFKY